MWGIPAFCRFCPEERGSLIGDSFLSKMAAVVLARASGYISAQWRGHKCSQVFVESVLLLFKSIHRLIGHFRVPLWLCFKASLSAKPFL